MRNYRQKDWVAFREEIIEIDGGACVRCKRRRSDGVTLQVHHKKYIPGKQLWEYPRELCETLCMGCHAAEHGKIRPSSGWQCSGADDLGELSGECELCGTHLRHVFFVEHPKWSPMEVGETCCDKLTGNSEASDYMVRIQRKAERKARFLQSTRWRPSDDGETIIQGGARISIQTSNDGINIIVDDVSGRQLFGSASDAKTHIFDILESGELGEFLRRRRKPSHNKG